MPRMQVRRGLNANLPTSGMLAGEEYFTTDLATLWIALDATTKVPVCVAVDQLATLAAPDGVNDMVMVWDVDASGTPKLKKMTMAAFKTALNIPNGDTDEKTAVVSGGTSGYIWGTDGTNGILRMGTTMSWTKDAGNGFVTLNVGTLDCGTF